MLVCVTVGGKLANSLAIMTDAAHMLSDFASFLISLFALWMANRPATQKMSFGYYRAGKHVCVCVCVKQPPTCVLYLTLLMVLLTVIGVKLSDRYIAKTETSLV